MRTVLIIFAAALEMVAWRLVARPGGANEWNVISVVLAIQGAIGLAAWHVDWSTDRTPAVSIVVGLSAGAFLYAATRAFVGVAGRVPVFRTQVGVRYRHARMVPLPLGLGLAILIGAPAEEIFWRGLVQGSVIGHTSQAVGVAVALAGYVVVKAASGSLPLIAAALVGGAVWGGLAVFAGGILTAVVCHGLWTGLMIAFPPAVGRAEDPRGEMMAP